MDADGRFRTLLQERVSLLVIGALQGVDSIFRGLDHVARPLHHFFPLRVKAIVARLDVRDEVRVDNGVVGAGPANAEGVLAPALSSDVPAGRRRADGGGPRCGRSPLEGEVDLIGQGFELFDAILHAIETLPQVTVSEAELHQALLETLCGSEAQPNGAEVQRLPTVHRVPFQLPQAADHTEEVKLIIVILDADSPSRRDPRGKHAALQE
mmetsp:Transcript_47636/g.132828  ORF Transcript_47636/g.132828 Transcript_47636/m.132828 type:complete len:210 (+) Transcript_47636:575-1204(+)